MSALANDTPLTFNEAMNRFRQNAESRREAMRDWERTIAAAAQAELEYSKAYARQIVLVEGTAAVREAQARANTAEERARRDVLIDMKRVCQERVRGLEGERANLNGLVDWSKRVDSGVGA